MPKDEDFAPIVDPRDVAFKMKTEYSRGVRDHVERALEAIIELSGRFEKPKAEFKALMRDTADLIAKRFGIASVAIALRDPSDDLFKYIAVVGLSDEVVKEFDKLKYREEQVLDESKYRNYEISTMSKLYLNEDHPYEPGEEFSYSRPGLLDMKRRSLTDALEADYIDTFFRGKGGQLMGWIELSGTRLRKLPDAVTIKWVELIACYLSVAIRARRLEEAI